MALTNTMFTQYGENRPLYVRVNNMSVSNHGVNATVLFRGYLSQEAFAANAQFVWEQEMELPMAVDQSLWSQAYQALKATEQFQNAEDC